MSVAYPIARGAAPALAAVGAVLFFDEPITFWIACGIGLVSSGVITIGLGHQYAWRASGAGPARFVDSPAAPVQAVPKIIR